VRAQLALAAIDNEAVFLEAGVQLVDGITAGTRMVEMVCDSRPVLVRDWKPRSVSTRLMSRLRRR